MRSLIRLALFGFAVAVVAACSGSAAVAPPQKRAAKPDPYVSILVTDGLDTTRAPGRADWHTSIRIVDTAVTSAMAPQGNKSLQDVRLGHPYMCLFVQADSVGARSIDFVAIADTMTDSLTADSVATPMFSTWNTGDTTLAAGWMALHPGLVNPWNSQQYAAGHGLTETDPIRWYLTWSGTNTVSLTERASTDTTAWPCR